MNAIVEQAQMGELSRRLGSIENKLDKLIRLEERQNNHDDELKRAFSRIEKCEDRLRVLEISDGRTDVQTNHNAGVISVVVSALVAVVVAVVSWQLKGS